MTKTAYERRALKQRIKADNQNSEGLKCVDLGHVKSGRDNFMDFPSLLLWSQLIKSGRRKGWHA